MSTALDEVTDDATPSERRTRHLLTAGLVVALVAGPLAGFALGRAGDDGRGGTVATGAGASTDAARSAAAMAQAPMPGGEKLEPLFRRTTGDGVVIRVYRSRAADAATTTTTLRPTCPPGAGCVSPPVCESGPVVIGELSTDAAVGTAGSFAGSVDGDAVIGPVSAGVFGVEEGAPARWVLLFVGDQVARVRATFPGGSTDEMEPVDGVALLASNVESTTDDSVTVEALDGSGNVIGTDDGGGTGPPAGPGPTLRVSNEASATASGSGSSSVSSVSSSGSAVTSICGTTGPLPSPPSIPAPPPSTLPAPGEQPADPVAARAAVEHAYSVAMDGSIGDSAAKIAAVEDGENVLATLEAAAQGTFGAQARASKAKVDDVVFTSPTEATVRYDIVIPGYTTFSGVIGRAVLSDGEWRVARDTMCSTVSLASVSCPPPK